MGGQQGSDCRAAGGSHEAPPARKAEPWQEQLGPRWGSAPKRRASRKLGRKEAVVAPGHPPATQRGHSSGAQNAFCRPAASGPAPGPAVAGGGGGRGGCITGPPAAPAQASAGSSVPAPRPWRPKVQPAVHIRPHRPAAPEALAAHAACTLPAPRRLADTLAALPALGHMETLLPTWGPGSLPPLPGLLQKGRGTPAQADPADRPSRSPLPASPAHPTPSGTRWPRL